MNELTLKLAYVLKTYVRAGLTFDYVASGMLTSPAKALIRIFMADWNECAMRQQGSKKQEEKW